MGRGEKSGRLKLRVFIESARNLRAADVSIFGPGSSDPYATCRVVGRPYLNVKTEHVNKTLDPVWNEEHEIEPYIPGDQLEFQVFDHDLIGGDDRLGRAVLRWDEFENGMQGGMVLEDAGKRQQGKAVINVRVQVIQLPAKQSNAVRCFVRIIDAKSLRPADIGGTSDPYASCEIVGKPHTLCRTKVMSKTVAPTWDEENELFDFEPYDDLEFKVYDFDRPGKYRDDDNLLGQVILKGADFYPQGLRDEVLKLTSTKGSKSTLNVSLSVVVPPVFKPPPVDPGAHVAENVRWPIPFALRSLETGYVHQLVAYTRIGRSQKPPMDPLVDLVLNRAGSADISKVHAVIKAWKVPDSNQWRLRVYDVQPPGESPGGYGMGPGGGHAGGGTSIHAPDIDVVLDEDGSVQQQRLDNRSVALKAHRDIGSELTSGALLRFGISELWVLDKVAIFKRSALAAEAARVARDASSGENPSQIRSLRVPRIACLHALRGCQTWFDFVGVVLEWLGEPDEPPCAKFVEIKDEVFATVSRHSAPTLDEQEAYDVSNILKDVNVGTTIRIILCSEPEVLGPVLLHLEEKQKHMELNRRRMVIPD